MLITNTWSLVLESLGARAEVRGQGLNRGEACGKTIPRGPKVIKGMFSDRKGAGSITASSLPVAFSRVCLPWEFMDLMGHGAQTLSKGGGRTSWKAL